MEINTVQVLSKFKTNSAEIKSDNNQEDFLLALSNAINNNEFNELNPEENTEVKNKIDVENLLKNNYLDIEFDGNIKEAEDLSLNEEIKSDKNIEIKDIIQGDEKDELSKVVEADNKDDLNKIDENLIVLTNRIFNNISYEEKQQFNITENNVEFKDNPQLDMNIVNNIVDKQQEIVDNLKSFVESNSNKDNIELLKKTYNFNEVKNKLTNLVENNFNFQESESISNNNVEENINSTNELEMISNFKVLSMKDNIKVNDNKNEINVLNNIAMNNDNTNLEVKTENLEPHVVRSEYISNDIVESINYLKVNNLEEIKVKMNPKDLGELHIKIIKENNEEKVFITLENTETFKLVKDNVAEIKNHLNNLEINVNEINIEMKSENRNDFSQNLNQQFNKGNNKEQRKTVKIETEKESSVENDLLKTDSNINMLI